MQNKHRNIGIVVWTLSNNQVILSLVRFIVSNKTARLVVFFYSVLLHGLVFAVLYKLVLTESCRQATIRKLVMFVLSFSS